MAIMFDSGALMGAIVALSMAVFMWSMRSFNREIRLRFIYMLVALFIAIIMCFIDKYLASFDTPQNFRYVTKIVKDICEGFIELQAVLVMDEHLNKAKQVAYAMPFIVISLILASAPLTHMVFYFDETNKYIRYNLGYLIYVEGIVYAIELIYICYIKWREGHQRDAVIIIFMVGIEALGCVIEEHHIVPNAIMGCASIGILFLYMYVYAERYNVDSVSHCYKRRCFYSDGIRYGGHTMAVISMDLNDLKEINDEHGHKAGDEALHTFASICKECVSNKFILYRTGGDEFMMLGIRATKDEAKAAVADIRKKLEPTGYSSSFGIAMYRAGDDFDEIVVKADKAMYADKKAYKKNNKRQHSRDKAGHQ